MSWAVYSARLPWGDTFRFRADLVEAGASIYIEGEEGWSSTTYQTADARHRETGALRLALQACTRDYFADPGDERASDEILDEIVGDVVIRVAARETDP